MTFHQFDHLGPASDDDQAMGHDDTAEAPGEDADED